LPNWSQKWINVTAGCPQMSVPPSAVPSSLALERSGLAPINVISKGEPAISTPLTATRTVYAPAVLAKNWSK